jgi:hypothetical protein
MGGMTTLFFKFRVWIRIPENRRGYGFSAIFPTPYLDSEYLKIFPRPFIPQR